MQHFAEPEQVWHGHTGGLRLTQRFQEHILQFQRLASLEVNQRGRLVSAHNARPIDIFVRQRWGDLKIQRVGGGDDFEHQFADELFPMRIAQQNVSGQNRGMTGDRWPAFAQKLRPGRQVTGWIRECVVTGGTSHAQTVEGNIPNKFLPMRAGKIISDVTRYSGLAKECSQFKCTWLRGSLKFAEHNLPVRRMLDNTRFDAIEADEAEATQDLFRGKQAGQFLLVTQTVLQRDDSRVWTDERREQFRELVVGRGLQPNQDYVAHTNFVRCPGASGLNVEITVNAADGHAFLPHDIVIGPKQEMHFLSGPAESGAVETTQRTATDNGDFHL